jgi:hypothetical protein
MQYALQRCNTLIEKEKHRYLINKKPAAPKINAYIKMHKERAPI